MSVFLTILATLTLMGPRPPAGDYFRIQVVDEATGRGVPLVELKTVNSITYYTDSNGIVAFYEPGLMDRDVFFHVSSHGYEFPADGFGYRGRTLRTVPGGSAELKIKRINIAERLYRITGGGIYRDSVLTGQTVPIDSPVLNGDVLGQDSVQCAVYRGKLYWFWGDTSWPKYPLGNFHMSGATSRLPSDGGLDPDRGVNLNYFVRENGFAREMAPHPGPGPVWADAFVTLPDDAGRERMYAAYARVTTEMKAVERGFLKYNDDDEVFERVGTFDVNAPVQPGGHPFKHADSDVKYIWFPTPFPLVRVPAETSAYLDVGRYEAWTPLKPGSTLDAPEIDRDASGRIRYAWRRNTPALDQKQQNELIKAGKLEAGEAWIQLRDADTGKAVTAHSGSVYWNDYRGRWITIRCEVMGTSMLGETWYAEADTPLGPWVYARKIVTHDKYSFYNPRQHPTFDAAGGRVIYFEGTFSHTFSGREIPTPRYDYNQIMYRLDLSDERLMLPVPVYRLDAEASRFATHDALSADAKECAVAFFAPDRPAPGTVPVYKRSAGRPGLTLKPSAKSTPVFHALPADVKQPPATAVPLYEFVHDDGHRSYSTDKDWSKPGYRRSDQPFCLIWRNPTTLRFPLD